VSYLISILIDGFITEKLLLSLTKKLSEDSFVIVSIPSFDCETSSGIHISLAFNNLLKVLSPEKKRTKYEYKLFHFLKKLNFIENKQTDLELTVSMLQTIWVKNGLPLRAFYERITRGLNISTTILPLLEPLPNLIIELEDGDKKNFLDVIDGDLTEKIKKISYDELDKIKLVTETKKVLENSDKILLFQISPLTVYFLKSIGTLKKILETFKGTILYLLPKKLRQIDKKFLSILKYSEDLTGLIQMSQEQVDAVIFDEKQRYLIRELSDVKLTLYPTPYYIKEDKKINEFIESLLKILE